MLLMSSLITLDHITLANLVSLNFQNQTWAFNATMGQHRRRRCGARRMGRAGGGTGRSGEGPRGREVVEDGVGREGTM
jgi:hypothetical protein